jgi:hypothetical protein
VVNDAPAFVLAAAPTAAEDAGPQLRSAFATDISAGPASELGQGLAFDVVVLGTDASLGFASPPAIDPSGNLRFAAAAESFGTATIEVRLRDDGGTANGGVAVSTPRSFTLSVLAVNDAPSFTAADPAPVPASFGPVTLPNWATGSTGPANESAQTLSYEVVAVSDPTQFAFGPAVTPDGTLRYTPATTAFGTTTVSIRVRDSGGTSAGGVDVSEAQTFSFTISPVVDALFNDGFETRN